MTIFGKHTIAEVRELARLVEFRIKAVQTLIAKINGVPGAGTNGLPLVDSGVIDTWNTWQGRWRRASDSALPLVTTISLSNPLVPADAIAVEDQYKKLKCAINASCDDTHTVGDMFEAITNVENAAGERIDETNTPQPDAGDPDLANFQRLDKAVRAGEAAAAAAKAGVSSAVKSNTGLLVLGGVGAIVGIVVLTKVYL